MEDNVKRVCFIVFWLLIWYFKYFSNSFILVCIFVKKCMYGIKLFGFK